MIQIDTSNMDITVMRGLVALRDKHCQWEGCGIAKDLEVHHIIPIAKNGDHSASNLITYCKKHHKQIHRILSSQEPGKLVLKKVLAEHGITISSLASVINVTQPTLSESLKKVPPMVQQAILIIKTINYLTGKSYIVEDLYRME